MSGCASAPGSSWDRTAVYFRARPKLISPPASKPPAHQVCFLIIAQQSLEAALAAMVPRPKGEAFPYAEDGVPRNPQSLQPENRPDVRHELEPLELERKLNLGSQPSSAAVFPGANVSCHEAPELVDSAVRDSPARAVLL